MGKFDKEYEKELLFQLHEQFSGNQNDTSSRFVTILVALFVLFGTYGLAFSISIKFISIEGWEISLNAVLMLAIVVGIILTGLIVLLIYQGYQHRRDQNINNKIRKMYTTPEKFENLFHAYKGEGKSLLEYIPDYIKIHAAILLILKIVLFASVLAMPNKAAAISDSIRLSKQQNITQQNNDSIESGSSVFCPCKEELKKESITQEMSGVLYTVAVIIQIVGCIIIIYMLIYYHNKYNKSNKKYIQTRTITRNENGQIIEDKTEIE